MAKPDDENDFGAAYVAQSASVRDSLQQANAGPQSPEAPITGIHTCIRVRPPLQHEVALYGQRIPGMGAASFAQYEYESVLVDAANGEVVVLSEERKIGKATGKLSTQRYSADNVFGGEADDEEDRVFDAAVCPLVRHVLAGGSAALISFGQTGAGKTHTSLCMQRRAAAALLAAPSVRAVAVSFLELYGDRAADLLRPDDPGDDGAQPGGAERTVTLRESGNGNGELSVMGLREVCVASAEEARAVLAHANALRAMAPTAANERSSRSHALCTLRAVLHTEEGGDSTDATTDAATDAGARLVLVDLAGSERREEMGTHDKERLAESRATNASLAALKECVRVRRLAASQEGGPAAAGKKPTVVPYRQSKLTRLLKPFLEKGGEGGEGSGGGSGGSGGGSSVAVCVLAHLSPLRSSGKHTASTLDFVGSLCGRTRQATELANFNRVEAWSAAEVSAWLSSLDNGIYSHLAVCFGGYTGKMLSIEWLGHVVKRVGAEGGSRADAERIYEAFHAELAAAKRDAQQGSNKEQGAGVGRANGPRRPSAGKPRGRGRGAALAASIDEVLIFEGPPRPRVDVADL